MADVLSTTYFVNFRDLSYFFIQISSFMRITTQKRNKKRVHVLAFSMNGLIQILESVESVEKVNRNSLTSQLKKMECGKPGSVKFGKKKEQTLSCYRVPLADLPSEISNKAKERKFNDNNNNNNRAF